MYENKKRRSQSDKLNRSGQVEYACPSGATACVADVKIEKSNKDAPWTVKKLVGHGGACAIYQPVPTTSTDDFLGDDELFTSEQLRLLGQH